MFTTLQWRIFISTFQEARTTKTDTDKPGQNPGLGLSSLLRAWHQGPRLFAGIALSSPDYDDGDGDDDGDNVDDDDGYGNGGDHDDCDDDGDGQLGAKVQGCLLTLYCLRLQVLWWDLKIGVPFTFYNLIISELKNMAKTCWKVWITEKVDFVNIYTSYFLHIFYIPDRI